MTKEIVEELKGVWFGAADLEEEAWQEYLAEDSTVEDGDTPAKLRWLSMQRVSDAARDAFVAAGGLLSEV